MSAPSVLFSVACNGKTSSASIGGPSVRLELIVTGPRSSKEKAWLRHLQGTWSHLLSCSCTHGLVQVCYVAFWDDITLKAQEAEGVSPDPVTGHVGVWRVVLVKNLPFVDQRRNGKIPKVRGWAIAAHAIGHASARAHAHLLPQD